MATEPTAAYDTGEVLVGYGKRGNIMSMISVDRIKTYCVYRFAGQTVASVIKYSLECAFIAKVLNAKDPKKRNFRSSCRARRGRRFVDIRHLIFQWTIHDVANLTFSALLILLPIKKALCRG